RGAREASVAGGAGPGFASATRAWRARVFSDHKRGAGCSWEPFAAAGVRAALSAWDFDGLVVAGREGRQVWSVRSLAVQARDAGGRSRRGLRCSVRRAARVADAKP